MSVPFDTLGPGQVARAVVQVLGRDGPIANPSGIRYLPIPGETVAAVGNSLLNANLALSGINLIASMGTLVLSAETLRQVHALHEKVDAIATRLESVDAKIDAVLAKVSRIDLRVAENNLRNALDHLARRAIGQTEIDLLELARVEADIHTMFDSIDNWAIGAAPGFRLSTDIADRLSAIYSFVASVRSLVTADYNRRVGGDPTLVEAFNPRTDYFVDSIEPNRVAGCWELVRHLRDARDRLKNDVSKRFSFADDTDQRHYHSWHNREVLDKALSAVGRADDSALSLALQLDDSLGEAGTFDSRVAFVDEYRKGWLWHTHAGLLWRTYVECLRLKQGYFPSVNFAAAGVELPPELTVACRVDADAVGALPGPAVVPHRASYATPRNEKADRFARWR